MNITPELLQLLVIVAAVIGSHMRLERKIALLARDLHWYGTLTKMPCVKEGLMHNTTEKERENL